MLDSLDMGPSKKVVNKLEEKAPEARRGRRLVARRVAHSPGWTEQGIEAAGAPLEDALGSEAGSQDREVPDPVPHFGVE